jgi:hypothetical protein
MFAFHSDPVVGDEFPCSFEARGASRILPLFDTILPGLFEPGEFRLRPMRPVFDGLTHGLRVMNPRGSGKFRVF